MEAEKTIGKYKILREVGKGGMAVVYKASDAASQKTVALKVLLPSMVDASTVERFNREAQCMAGLKHPNIAEVCDFGITKGNHYFAMEFIEGETLSSMVKRRGALPVDEALDIICQAAEALAYAHGLGIIHRDIKSGNIMVDARGNVKVMDFGLVQIPGVTRVTVQGSILGTAEYMSPEQISDQEVDIRSDIYSLGITMYEVLTGQPPFKADSFQAVLMKHKYEMPPSMRTARPEMPVELERINMKALSKDVSRRYQNMKELLEDIDKFRPSRPPGSKTGTVKEAPRGTQDICRGAQLRAPTGSKKKKIYLKVAGIITAGGLICAGCLYYLNNVRPQAPGDLKGQTRRYLEKIEAAEDHHSRGAQLYGMGLIDGAIKEYKKAINLKGDSALYYQDLALAYERNGDAARAVKAWQDALKYSQSEADKEAARQHIEKLNY